MARPGRTWRRGQDEEAIAVHRHRPVMCGRLRVKWLPLYYATAEGGGQEQLEGMRPCLQNVAATD
eukprot:13118560-Alexandrium_andersonii.AAC.1